MYPEEHCSWDTNFWYNERKVRGDEYGIREEDYISCNELEKSSAQTYYIELQRKYPQSKFVNEMKNKSLATYKDYVLSSTKYAEEGTWKMARELGISPIRMTEREYEKLGKKMAQFLNNYRITSQNLNFE